MGETRVEGWVGATPEAVAKEAARRFAVAAEKAIRERGRFAVALAGGSTPRAMNELLAQPPYAGMVDWSKVEIYFGDERTVPPSHMQSNYRMTKETLLDHVAIPADKIHRIEGEGDPLMAARSYEMVLRSTAVDVIGTAETGIFPRLDLVMLGMGPDGHTASLFPRTTALEERYRLVVENFVEKQNAWRITMTAPMLNAAREIVLCICGAEKGPVLKTIRDPSVDALDYPVLMLEPVDGKIVWLLDKAAKNG